MKKRIVELVVLGLAVTGLVLGADVPASKAAAAITKFVPLSASCFADSSISNPNVCYDDTGWVTVQTLKIKTANKKDLAIDTAFECGLVTFTGVSSKNGDGAVSLAAGRIRVRVRITDNTTGAVSFAEPTGSPLTNGAGINYCSRLQALAAVFNGIDCHLDTTTDDVNDIICDNPEFVALLMRTIEASAFNFMAVNVGPGVKTIQVQARGEALDAAFSFGPGGRGVAYSEAFVGAGSTLVEEVRLINSVDTVVLD